MTTNDCVLNVESDRCVGVLSVSWLIVNDIYDRNDVIVHRKFDVESDDHDIPPISNHYKSSGVSFDYILNKLTNDLENNSIKQIFMFNLKKTKQDIVAECKNRDTDACKNFLQFMDNKFCYANDIDTETSDTETILCIDIRNFNRETPFDITSVNHLYSSLFNKSSESDNLITGYNCVRKMTEIA